MASTIEVTGPTAGTVTVRAQGAPPAETLAAALAAAARGTALLLVDLTRVDHFTTEAVEVLLPHVNAPGYRVRVFASAAVRGKLARLGLTDVVTPKARSLTEPA
ncbi:hypothetical protein M8542_32415 [Amycolatopsis sp. OK19-0408]|uniref:STAS domain-containing protein n=1 Tax=Amycolatopsis iheyensis TaxID=2945988 RepID=A0A9X2NGV8_9PSEU|nr:hypothetical protein [Amycolatopsis iheyensis]MCR6487542.1 hypothetical protein [Amycolatopsis iheyensis]